VIVMVVVVLWWRCRLWCLVVAVQLLWYHCSSRAHSSWSHRRDSRSGWVWLVLLEDKLLLVWLLVVVLMLRWRGQRRRGAAVWIVVVLMQWNGSGCGGGWVNSYMDVARLGVV
jgi:lysylphosphatidylglycerol synthetase-like protein (DUF2156 family)